MSEPTVINPYTSNPNDMNDTHAQTQEKLDNLRKGYIKAVFEGQCDCPVFSHDVTPVHFDGCPVAKDERIAELQTAVQAVLLGTFFDKTGNRDDDGIMDYLILRPSPPNRERLKQWSKTLNKVIEI